MTEFDKAVKHVETCLFWDFFDGQWLDKLCTPLDRDFFNWLMQGVVEAHEAENAKLRELLSSYWKGVHSPVAPNVERDYLAEMRELGVEVD